MSEIQKRIERGEFDYVLITNGYPKDGVLYNNAFIHRRVLNYRKRGIKGYILVVHSKISGLQHYRFEGIDVFEGNPKTIIPLIEKNKNSKIFVHFIDYHLRNIIEKYLNGREIFVWIHGMEALSWKRRLFKLTANPKSILSFLKYIIINRKQLGFMKKLHTGNQENMNYIFVSNWMKEIFESDAHVKISQNKYAIIPNIIDEEVFNWVEKDSELRREVFSIRPYTSRKYANDILVKSIIKFSEYDQFKKFSFNLYGDGPLFEKTLKPLRKKNFSNVTITKTFLKQSEITALHKKHGVVLAPTRQDAQGVSVCEAISSGLVPIVSNNTAMPEFIKPEFGYLCDSVEDFVQALLNLDKEKDAFVKKSRVGATFITDTCGSHVIQKEIDFVFKGK